MELGQRFGESLYNENILEFRNVSKELLVWLEQITIENNCRVEKKEWRSKYNSYVVYDYEPFCSDGFEISITITAANKDYLRFIQFLYEDKLQTIEHLNNCLSV